MKAPARWIALIVVFVAAAAVVAYKRSTVRHVPVSTGVAHQKPSVLLVADLSEAEERCACGEIIRAVRAAQRSGVPTQELTPDSNSELMRRYRILTAPTVVFLDATGQEVARYEGEDEKTVEAIRSHLKRITEAGGTLR